MSDSKSWWESYGSPGLQHALGAMLIQALTAVIGAWGYGVDIFQPALWVAGAGIGSAFFVGREYHTCQVEFGTWLVFPRRIQARTPFDVLTAVVPAALVAAALTIFS